jgi:hypothetical protein
LQGTGPLHWRGDRSAAAFGGDAFDADGNLKTFNVAFPGLLGRSAPLDPDDVQAFTDFVLSLVYPPNPYRPLDDVPTESMRRGEQRFRDDFNDEAGTCNTCHQLQGAIEYVCALGLPVALSHRDTLPADGIRPVLATEWRGLIARDAIAPARKACHKLVA